MEPAAPRPVHLADLTGVVVRTLLVDEDGTQDATTRVTWVQGLSLYVDLRRPAALPDHPDLAAAAHEGFAGRCEQTTDGVTHWHRLVDVRPPGPTPDAGRLCWRGDEVIETGVHARYVEHWRPEPVPADAPVVGAVLADRDDGRPAVLVRVADRFGWARGRGPDDDPADPLAAVVALGRVTPDGWIVETATLPAMEGLDLAPRSDGDGIRTADRGPRAGGERAWDVVAVESRGVLTGSVLTGSVLTGSVPTTKE